MPLQLKESKELARPEGLPEGAPANLAIDLATEYVRTKALYDAAWRTHHVAETNLMFVLQSEWENSIREGSPLPSVDLPTSTGETIQVVFPERFRGLDPANRAALMQALGSEYTNLVEERDEVQLRSSMTLSELEQLVGPTVMRKLDPHLIKRGRVRPRRGAVARLGELFAQGSSLAEDLLEFIRAAIATPHLRLPRETKESSP